jgi:hypothetical protein
MADKQKDEKKVRPYYVKKVNIDWIAEKAFSESEPGDKVSESAFLDRLIDQARTQSPTRSKKNAALVPLAS